MKQVPGSWLFSNTAISPLLQSAQKGQREKISAQMQHLTINHLKILNTQQNFSSFFIPTGISQVVPNVKQAYCLSDQKKMRWNFALI